MNSRGSKSDSIVSRQRSDRHDPLSDTISSFISNSLLHKGSAEFLLDESVEKDANSIDGQNSVVDSPESKSSFKKPESESNLRRSLDLKVEAPSIPHANMSSARVMASTPDKGPETPATDIAEDELEAKTNGGNLEN